MSVINQMLNQLEQRGAHTVAEQTMVRAVPPARRSVSKPLLAAGAVFALGLAVWQGVQLMNVTATAEQAPQNIAQATSSPPGSAEKLAVRHPAEEISVASAPAAAETVVPSIPELPASRLSFELSSVPLPSAVTARKNPGTDSREVSASPAKAASPQPVKTDASQPLKHISAAQQADGEFRKAVALMQQGRLTEARAGYEAALRLDAAHDAARQALVALLLESKHSMDAEHVLQERLNSKPNHTGFTMLLARLQVERGAVAEATATLEKALPYASSQADYQAFLAALLQRQNRNNEAILHYQAALQLAPANGIWLMGYGISLQAMQRNTDAKNAYQHALDTKTLSPDLQAFVQQKIKGL